MRSVRVCTVVGDSWDDHTNTYDCLTANDLAAAKSIGSQSHYRSIAGDSLSA